MTIHPTEQELHDFIDDELAAAAALHVGRHAAGCATCRASIDELRRLRQRLAHLPRDIAPPAGTLRHIHDLITADQVAGSPAFIRPLRRRRAGLAAAAIALMALSSAITAALVLRYGPSRGVVRDDVSRSEYAVQLTALGIMETSYIDAITELERVLQEQQHVLAPETVRLVRANLDVIDRALEEARAALRDDPANVMLVDLLRAGYERKLDVLRSASTYAATRL